MIPFGPVTRVGLDLGTRAVRACIAEVRGERIQIKRCCQIERRALEQGDLQGFARNVAAFFVRENIPLKDIVLALPPASSVVRYSSVPPAPPWRVDLLAQFEVEEVAERMGEPLCAGWRVEEFPNELGERPLLLVLGKEGEINDLLGAFERAGLRVTSAVPTAEALWRAWRLFVDPPPPATGAGLLLELGEHFAHVLLSMDGELLFARQAPLGGEIFNQALAERVQAAPEEIERLKLLSSGLEANGSKRDFSSSFRRPAGQLVNLLKGAVTWAEGRLRQGRLRVSQLVLSGGAARLRGLDNYLQRSMGCHVTYGKVRAPSQRQEDLAYGFLPAIGLCSVNPGDPKVLEVLPRAVKERRKFWQEKVYLYGTCVLLSLFLLLQLVAGFKRVVTRRAVMSRLTNFVERLEGDSAQYEERAKRMRSISLRQRALDRCLEETVFYGKLLSYLGRELAPTVQLVGIQSVPRRDRESPAEVEIEGLADNSNRQAVSLIQSFENGLSQQSFVDSVTLLSEYSRLEPQRNAYRFRLRVRAKVRKKGEGAGNG